MLYIRVRIIASHFVNCKVNSSYCDCKLVKNTKIAKQLFSKGKFNSLKLYFSTLYPYFIYPLHIITKRNIFIPKLHHKMQKKLRNSQTFPKNIFGCGGVKASLHSVYLLRREFQAII